MGWLKKILGKKIKNPEEDQKLILERFENLRIGVDGTIYAPKFGHPRCPKCNAKHPLTADQIRAMMQQMNEDVVPLIVCHECGAKIRVKH